MIAAIGICVDCVLVSLDVITTERPDLLRIEGFKFAKKPPALEKCIWIAHTFDPGDEDIQVWFEPSCAKKNAKKAGEFCSYCGKAIEVQHEPT